MRQVGTRDVAEHECIEVHVDHLFVRDDPYIEIPIHYLYPEVDERKKEEKDINVDHLDRVEELPDDEVAEEYEKEKRKAVEQCRDQSDGVRPYRQYDFFVRFLVFEMDVRTGTE